MGYKIESNTDHEDYPYTDKNDPNFRYVFNNKGQENIITGYDGVVTYFEGGTHRGTLVKDEEHLKSLLRK